MTLTEPATPNHIELPSELSTKYEPLGELGFGGMGVVYKARHRMTKQIVAIKLLRGDKATNSQVVLRFKQEAEAASKLSHPNVIVVHDFGVAEDIAYLIMEFVEGKDLSDLIASEKITPERFKQIFLQVCDGLAHAHRHGIVHRDLKPSNILISMRTGEQQIAKIADFGIAKLTTDESTQHLTKTGEICGSPLYMSPEQCIGQAADFRSDIFSLGCVMYEAVTGKVPNAGHNTLETIHRRTNEAPRSFTECGVTFNAQMEEVIMHCLEKDPAARYQSVDALKNDLEQGRISKKSSLTSTLFIALTSVCVLLALLLPHHEYSINPAVREAHKFRKQAEADMEAGHLKEARQTLVQIVLPLLKSAKHDKAFKEERKLFLGTMQELAEAESHKDALDIDGSAGGYGGGGGGGNQKASRPFSPSTRRSRMKERLDTKEAAPSSELQSIEAQLAD